MKKLITILIIILSIGGYAQQVNDSIPKITETERIIDKYGGKAVDAFNQVVEKAMPLAEEGIEIAVKLQIARGVSLLLPLLFFIIFFRLFVNEYNRINNILNSDNVPNQYDSHEGPLDNDNVNPKLILYISTAVILLLASLFTTYDGIMHLAAPEWFAIKDIIELVK